MNNEYQPKNNAAESAGSEINPKVRYVAIENSEINPNVRAIANVTVGILIAFLIILGMIIMFIYFIAGRMG